MDVIVKSEGPPACQTESRQNDSFGQAFRQG